MQSSSFVIDSERIINDARFILKHPLYVFDILSLNIPVKILVPRVTMSNTLNSSSHSHIINFKLYSLNPIHIIPIYNKVDLQVKIISSKKE